MVEGGEVAEGLAGGLTSGAELAEAVGTAEGVVAASESITSLAEVTSVAGEE